MQTFRLALHSLKRDWRSGEVGLIAAAVVIAVASMTSVGFFTDRVHKALGRQATELLAADLVLDSRAPIPHRLRTDAREHGLDTTETLRFRSVVVRDDKLQMAEVKAVEAVHLLKLDDGGAVDLGDPRQGIEHLAQQRTVSCAPQAQDLSQLRHRVVEKLGVVALPAGACRPTVRCPDRQRFRGRLRDNPRR